VSIEQSSKIHSAKTEDVRKPVPRLGNAKKGGVTATNSMTGDFDESASSASLQLEEKSTTSNDSGSKKKKASWLRRDSSASSTPSVSKSKATHQEIEVEHREYEVTFDMMLGIRTMVGVAYQSKHREIAAEDFEHVAKRTFPSAGSNKTPAHKMRDFKFKDYHPEVFRRIRERFGIDAAEYTMTVTNNPYLEFISNSKSGQFFFFTHNKQFMIKTMSKEECKFLRKILPSYFKYVMENQNTLLTRYYGIHRVQPAGSRKIRFLIMGSVFFTDKFIHESFDLKGSTYGRAATAKEKEQAVPVLKDLDFLDKKVKIQIQPEKASELVAQIEKDSQV
jgi:1-phosphatidylinositol-4-phosphate 5-kinase